MEIETNSIVNKSYKLTNLAFGYHEFISAHFYWTLLSYLYIISVMLQLWEHN